jgi:hypothetical protein
MAVNFASGMMDLMQLSKVRLLLDLSRRTQSLVLLQMSFACSMKVSLPLAESRDSAALIVSLSLLVGLWEG